MIHFQFLLAVGVVAIPLICARQFCVNNERSETWTVYAFAPDGQFCHQQELSGGGQQYCFDLPNVLKGGVIWAEQQSRTCGGPGKSPLAEFTCEADNVCWIDVDYENGRQYEIDMCPSSDVLHICPRPRTGNGGASVEHGTAKVHNASFILEECGCASRCPFEDATCQKRPSGCAGCVFRCTADLYTVKIK